MNTVKTLFILCSNFVINKSDFMKSFCYTSISKTILSRVGYTARVAKLNGHDAQLLNFNLGLL